MVEEDEAKATAVRTVWVVVVPVKRLDRAKSRLELPPQARRDLALAMASDTVAAALAAPGVAAVVVVTDDLAVAAAAEGLGAVALPDEPDAGLNRAIGHGESAARRLLTSDRGSGRATWPDADARGSAGIAALSADVPALTATSLSAVLRAAEGWPRGVVADAAGTGTTLLTTTAPAGLQPLFGLGSLARHVARGDADLTSVAGAGLRQDVDTLADLDRARLLGVGPRTAQVLADSRDNLTRSPRRSG